MRISTPDDHFVTSMTSGKVGVLRAQSTCPQLLTLLAEEPDLWHSAYGSTGVGGPITLRARAAFEERLRRLDQ